jgi:hypothetical protein
MKRSIAAFILSALLLVNTANAQSSDKDSDGVFTGIALITDNPRWHELFQRPEVPQISGVSRLTAGERGTLALLFSNAEPRNGMVKIACDVTAFDPNGSRSVVESGPCYEGPFSGPNILHPTLLDLSFAIGADEPEGQAGFKVKLRDVHSGRTVDLTVSFTQGGKR